MDWLQWITASGAVGALGIALAAYLRTRPAMKEAQIHGEAALWARIKALEEAADHAGDACEERIKRAEERHDAAMAKVEAEIQVLRHDRNNVRQGLNALLAMIKRDGNPKLASIAEAVEEMVHRGDQAIAVEKAAIPTMKRARV